MSEVMPQMILTQAISVIYFTLDTNPSAIKSHPYSGLFGKGSWKFHHVTEPRQTDACRFTARQEYYELSPELPLFSTAMKHTGTNVFRVNIFTKNYSEMINFYSRLLGANASLVRENFAYFTFDYTEDSTLELSLKNDSGVMPYPISQTDLLLTLKEIPDLEGVTKITDDLHQVLDPDENSVFISQTPSDHELSILSTQSESKPADISNDDKLKAKCESSRPDVIPEQDPFKHSSDQQVTKSSKMVTCPTNVQQDGKNPAKFPRRLIIHTNSNSSKASKHVDKETITKTDGTRRHSVDIIETF